MTVLLFYPHSDDVTKMLKMLILRVTMTHISDDIKANVINTSKKTNRLRHVPLICTKNYIYKKGDVRCKFLGIFLEGKFRLKMSKTFENQHVL